VCQPTTLVLSLALFLGTAARAQPSPAREQRQRSITITGNPADPPPEIRVAQNVTVVLLFKSRINREGIEVDRTRVTIVDAGDRSVVFEPLLDLGFSERLVLSVPFADGQRAVFVLVSSPSEVDTRIDVIRHEHTVESCQAELAAAQARCATISPAAFARAGWLTHKGVIAREIDKCTIATRTASGLHCVMGTAYRAEAWALVEVMISNKSNGHPWVPSEVTIKGMKSGVLLTVRAVEMEPAQTSPGEVWRVFVETEPPTNAGEPFVLELRDAAGPGITIGGVDLSTQENKP
jgi:uncharacterized protein (TIGR02268 family)